MKNTKVKSWRIIYNWKKQDHKFQNLSTKQCQHSIQNRKAYSVAIHVKFVLPVPVVTIGVLWLLIQFVRSY